MHAIKFAFKFDVCPRVLHQPGKGNAQEPPPLDARVLPHVVNQIRANIIFDSLFP